MLLIVGDYLKQNLDQCNREEQITSVTILSVLIGHISPKYCFAIPVL